MGYYDGLFAGAYLSSLVVFSLVFYILFVIAMWRIFEKAGEAGWKSIIPIWNTYILYKITWGSGIYFLLLLIPIANIVVSIVTCYKLAKAFRHGVAFTLGLIFFPWIFSLILGFGSDEYQGIE